MPKFTVTHWISIALTGGLAVVGAIQADSGNKTLAVGGLGVAAVLALLKSIFSDPPEVK